MSEHPTDSASGETSGSSPAEATPEEPKPSPLTFRITPVALLGALAVAICASPLALSAPWLAPLFLIPMGLAAWIMRTRTVIDSEHVLVQRVLHSTRFGWDDVRSVKLDEKRWLRAVLHSGKEVCLPAVRVRDLPRLAKLSGGRLPDPTSGGAEPADAEPTPSTPDETGS